MERADSEGQATRTILRADKERGIIILDDKTTLSGVPSDAWRYMLGSRSALEWVLDQYKEKKPRDPTIRDHFNTYRFADYKERVIDLLRRVCTVSVRTMDVVDDMAYWDDDKLIVFGDRDQMSGECSGCHSGSMKPKTRSGRLHGWRHSAHAFPIHGLVGDKDTACGSCSIGRDERLDRMRSNQQQTDSRPIHSHRS